MSKHITIDGICEVINTMKEELKDTNVDSDLSKQHETIGDLKHKVELAYKTYTFRLCTITNLLELLDRLLDQYNARICTLSEVLDFMDHIKSVITLASES